MNLLKETEEVGGLMGIEWAAVKHAMGSFVLKPGYDKEAKENFIAFLDLDLYTTYTKYPKVDGIIVYKNGSWLERFYDDCCDCGWVLKKTPVYNPIIANNVNKKWDPLFEKYEDYYTWDEESDWKCEHYDHYSTHLSEQWYNEWHDINK